MKAPDSTRTSARRIVLLVGVLLAIALVVIVLRPFPPSSRAKGRVILVAIDGGSLPLVRELVAAGRLPGFRRLIETGAVGGLASIHAELPFSPQRGAGYWSPLVWTSIATGREPAAHGVVDFRLPNPTEYRVCTAPGAKQASVTLPGHADAIGVRVVPAPGSAQAGWLAQLSHRQELFTVPASGSVDLPLADPGRPPRGLALRFHATSETSDPLCLQSLSLFDPNGSTVVRVHFIADRVRFASGWAEPRFGKLRGAGTDHRQVKAIWNILSDLERKVAIVGWRDSWPAERVNGYYISDRLSLRIPSRSGADPFRERHVIHPEDLTARVRPFVERLPEIESLAERSVLSVAPCVIPERDGRVARGQYAGDWLRHTLALELWDTDPSIDFLAVYYSGIDAFGHMFLPQRERRGEECHIDPPLVDRYYAVVDRYLGDWLERLDPGTTLVVVTDHGMVAVGTKGRHADTGFAILAGDAVRGGARLSDAHVLDVAPTVLYLLGLPLASDMRGEPPWDAMAWRYQASQPVRRVGTYETGEPGPEYAEPLPEIEAELMERLRALGYLD